MVWPQCMQGNDDVVEEDLFEGTSKSMEWVLSDECYEQAKAEGCNVEVVWQDADSSSSKSVLNHFPDGKVYKCGGHVGRAHINNLKELAKMKTFSATFVSKHKEELPPVQSLKCKFTRHKSGCGCLSDAFLKRARLNHFCCLQQCREPSEYARRMEALCRDIHEWGNEMCGFHDNMVCSCKECDEDEGVQCEGTPYLTKVPSFEVHWLAYRIKCKRRALDAEFIIHPV